MSIDTADPVYQLWLAFRGSVSRAECQAKVDQYVLDGQAFPAEIEELLGKAGIDVRARRWTLIELVQYLVARLITQQGPTVEDYDQAEKFQIEVLRLTAENEALRTRSERAEEYFRKGGKEYAALLAEHEALKAEHARMREQLASVL